MSTGQAWAAEQDDIYYNEYLPLCRKLGLTSFHRFREWQHHLKEIKRSQEKSEAK